jgi:molybdate transport system substrate-binding protein
MSKAAALVVALGVVVIAGCRPSGSARTALTVRGGPLLRTVFTEIGSAFSSQHPEIDLRSDFSCPPCVLTSKIREGIDLDVFVSAGDVELDALAKEGVVDRSTRRPMGTAQLVLVVPAGNPAGVRGLGDLHRAKVTNIALGDTETTSPGHYTRQAFEKMGLWEEVKPKLLMTKTGCEALKSVAIGKADAAVLYAFCLEDESGKPQVVAKIPPQLHQPIVLSATLAPRAPQPAATEFADFLQSPAAQQILRKHNIQPVTQ